LFTELPRDARVEALLSDITALKSRIEKLYREHPPGRELPAGEEWHVARGYAGIYAQLAEVTGSLVDLYYDQHHYDLGDAANRAHESYLTLWRRWRERAEQARAQLTSSCKAHRIDTNVSVRGSRCERPVTTPCEAIA
jgi:hypothetical protein